MKSRHRIRLASKEDASVLAELGARTFRATFAEDNEPDDMEAYLARAFSVEQMTIELEEPNNTFFLAGLGEKQPAIGYAKLRIGHRDPAVTREDTVELERIYVSEEAIGQGVGAALMERSIEAAQESGRDSVWLGVWERNERAIDFYRRFGFEIVGSHVFVLGQDHQNDHVMELTLT